MILTGSFMAVEVVGGVLSGSLALIADAGHMFTDMMALSLSWLAFRVSEMPPDGRRSYGYHRFQVLAAFINGVSLVVLVGWIVFEAAGRILEPVEVMGTAMLVVAALGLVVNIISFTLLHGGDRENLNIKGAAAHVLGDMLGSAAAVTAAIVILATGWTPIDPILSIFVAALIFRSALDLVKRSAHVLLEGSPEWLDMERLKRDLTSQVDGVLDIHHVHAWSLTTQMDMITLHAIVDSRADYTKTLEAIKAFLIHECGIGHSTVQIELKVCCDEPGKENPCAEAASTIGGSV